MIVIAVYVSGIDYFGGVPVSEVPPLVDFVSENGRTIFTPDMITRSGEVFHLRARCRFHGLVDQPLSDQLRRAGHLPHRGPRPRRHARREGIHGVGSILFCVQHVI